jgi:hypothetical protein
MGDLSITIPESKNPDWFNSFIAAIFYSKYSRKLLKKDERNKIKSEIEKIFNFTKKFNDVFNEYIRIAEPTNQLSSANDHKVNYSDIEQKFKDISFYDYLLTNNKQLTAFILPKFLEFIKSSCISVERYDGKNYIGLYDYSEIKNVNRTLLNLYQKPEISLKETIKISDIKKKYNEAKDYILINKWANDKNTPKILNDVSKMNQDGDEDGIDNKYRLSSAYKKDGDLNITDNIDLVIEYNGHYYDLDSCIITNIDDNKKSQLITCLTYGGPDNDNDKIDNSYIYIGKNCPKLHEYDWLNNDFSIYPKKPCYLYNSHILAFVNDDDKKNISTFNLNKGSNYTLIYVKFKNIDDKKAEEKQKELDEQKELEEEQKKADEEKQKKQAKQKEERQKEEKLSKFNELEKETKQQKDIITKLQQKLKNANEEDIKAINEIEKKIKSPKKDEYNQLKSLLVEYISLLRDDETEFKDYDYIKKISEIDDEIKKFNTKKEAFQQRPTGSRVIHDKLDNFLDYYDNISLYLNKYKYYIINFLARQKTIELLKDEIKYLPNDERISQILDAKLKKIEDLLIPTDAKLKQILEAIFKLPNDAKLKKIEDLLTPTDAKLKQILDAIEKLSKDDKIKVILDEIAKIPNEAKINDLFKALIKDLPKADNTREILDAISKMPKEDNKKLLQDLNAKIDAMQQDLLSKIQEQKSTNSRTIQPEIAELRRQLQLMGDIQKQLSEATKNDHTKIIETLNSKLDDMQQILIDKLQNMEIKKSSSSNDKITLQSEIASLNQQLKLLEDIQTKIAQSGERDNKQLLQDMQQELLKYSEKDNQKIISGVQDLLRLFNKEIVLKQNEKDVIVHKELERNIKEQLVLLKDIQSKLENGDGNNSNCKNENNLLKLENTELKQQIEILKDIQSKCKRQQQDYEKCNKHNMLPYKYIKFKEDELLAAIKDNFKGKGKQSDKIIIEFIFKYFEKNNKVMNVYLIEKYMGDIYDVMKIFNKKYNIDDVDIKQFYRLLASISIYAKFNEVIKKNIY